MSDKNYVYKSVLAMKATAFLLICSTGVLIYEVIKNNNLKQSHFQENRKMLLGSVPILNKTFEVKINGIDTIKSERIDTVAWIVPNHLVRK